MDCAKCATKIEKSLARLDGIIAAQVNYASERASFVYDPARVNVATVIEAVRAEGFETPLERVTLNVRGLMYASSANSLERILSRGEGVARASVDLRSRRVTIEALPDRENGKILELLLARLGFPVEGGTAAGSAAGFVVRGVLAAAAAVLPILLGAGHLIASATPGLTFTYWLIPTAIALLGADYPLWRRAAAALASREFDPSVLMAVFTAATFFGGLALALLSSIWPAVASSAAWAALTASAISTCAWFLVRGSKLWEMPPRWRPYLPPLVGTIGALAVIGVYLGILSLLQSPSHASSQFSQDWLWVLLVAVGFGTQVGLYAYLRQIIHSMKLAGETALTGAGTGTSTIGMVACCAHHIADVAPLVGLASASGVSGIISFVGAYKIPIVIFGLLVNLAGIAASLRTIRRQRAHLHGMQASMLALESVPACH